MASSPASAAWAGAAAGVTADTRAGTSAAGTSWAGVAGRSVTSVPGSAAGSVWAASPAQALVGVAEPATGAAYAWAATAGIAQIGGLDELVLLPSCVAWAGTAAATRILGPAGAAHRWVWRLGPDRWGCRLGPDRWAARLGREVRVRTSTQVQVPVQVRPPVPLDAVQLLQFCTNTTDQVPESPDWQALLRPDSSVWTVGEWVTLLAPVGPGLPIGSLYIISRVKTADEDFQEVVGYRQVRP
jgi:hypothetical protein